MAEDSGRVAPEPRDHAFLAHLAENPRIRAHQHHRRQRLCQAAGGQLSAALRDSLGDLGIHAPLSIMQSNGGLVSPELARDYPIRIVESGPAAGVLHVRRGRPRRRLRPCPDLRHGRHHRQARRHRRRRAGDHADVRGRCRQLRPGQRPAAQHHGDRTARDRRRRRQHRARQDGADLHRTGQRRRRSGTDLLRARRHRSDHHRRQPRARATSIRRIFNGGAMQLDVDGAADGIAATSATPLGLAAERSRMGHPFGRQRQHGAGDAHRLDRARTRSADATRWWHSAAPARCTPAGWHERWTSRA